MTLLEAARRLEAGEVTSEALVEGCLARIAEVEPRLNALVAVDVEGARAQARSSDQRRASGGRRSVLEGIPVVLKDNIVTTRMATTAGSRILAGYRSPFDATVARRLLEAGAVVVAKANLDEFAMGSSSETGVAGPVHNPWALTHTAGGSSGGSAAAVAAGEALAALGSDTGGSVRQPAALTGVVGLKPTWGRVSRYGLVAYASSLDQVGPLTLTVEDAAAVLEVIAGADPHDATCADRPVPRYLEALTGAVEGLRIGLPREYFVEGMDGDVAAAVQAAAQRFRDLGAAVEEVALPHTRLALATYYLVATAEASSNLARFDGVRYGHRTADPRSLSQLYSGTRREGFGDEVKRRILLGTFALSAGYHDAYAVKAQQVRTLIRGDFEAVFRSVDVVLSATSPVPAWRLGEKLGDPLSMYLMDVLTIPTNLAGLPAISVPMGRSRAGLPLGLQLVAPAFGEVTLLNAALAFERALGPLPRPPGVSWP